MPHILLRALCTLRCLLTPAQLYMSYVLFVFDALHRCSASCNFCTENARSFFGRALELSLSVTRCRSSWLLFYIIEAVAVYSVLAKYPNDADAAVSCPFLLCAVLLTRRLPCFHLAAINKSAAVLCGS